MASIAIEKENHTKAIKKSNKKLQLSEHKLAQLFDTALAGLMYIDQDRILIKGNQHLADIFGYKKPQEMVGICMRELHLSEERFLAFGKANFQTLIHRANHNIEYQLKKKDGSTIWCELSGKALDQNTPADLSKGVLWTVKDITKNKELQQSVEEKNEQLKELAIKDYLTGLYNRSMLDKSLEDQIKHSKRYDAVFGVIMMDIDYFKLVNDEHGHQVGDEVLSEFAKVLTSISRETDVVGRWGGEEFLIIVENINKDGIIKLAQKIRESVEEHEFPVVKHKTVSLGTTVYNQGEKINELIGRADKALYKAKNNGRNQVQYL